MHNFRDCFRISTFLQYYTFNKGVTASLNVRRAPSPISSVSKTSATTMLLCEAFKSKIKNINFFKGIRKNQTQIGGAAFD